MKKNLYEKIKVRVTKNWFVFGTHYDVHKGDVVEVNRGFGENAVRKGYAVLVENETLEE